MDRLIEKITGAVKNPKILIALGLTGILLICLPSFFGGSKKNETVRGGEINVEEYRAGLEKSVEEIVSSITGSKSVKVVITLESGIIYSYADTNEGVSANKTGSGQESTSSESKQSYITVKTADGGRAGAACHPPKCRRFAGWLLFARGATMRLLTKRSQTP